MYGALIGDVMRGGPADKGGLRKGDLVIGLNGRAIPNSRMLRNRVAEVPPGSRIELDVWRRGKKTKLSVVLGAQPPEPPRQALRPAR